MRILHHSAFTILRLLFLLALGLTGCNQVASDCHLATVRLVYLEPVDTPPGGTLPENWIARRCLGIVTVADAAEVPPLLSVSPTVAFMVHRSAVSVLEQQWIAREYEEHRPIIGLDMSMSELDSAAPFVRAPVLTPVRRPGELIWAGICRHSEGERRTAQRFVSTTQLIEWSTACR